MGTLPVSSGLGDGSISVALCTYNGSLYLGEQLASIASQTYKPVELVVCDDGSQDNTIDLLSEFARSVEYPVYIHRNERNLGSTKNFEQAIGLCSGEFIALCDQDDWWDDCKLESLFQALCQTGAGGAFSNGLLMDADSRLVRGTVWDSIRFNPIQACFNSGSREQVTSVLLRSNVVTGATLMFRSELREHLMQFPSEWVHDGWLAWMIALHSRLVAVPEPLIRYRVHKKQQISIPRYPITDRLNRARRRGMDDCLETARQFEILLEYAKSHTAICSPQLRKGLEEKRDHLYFRAGLAGNRIKRWSQICAERRAYRIYAQGWLSMFKDAFV